MINKEQIICEISSKKIIAIARGIYGEQCINLAKALYDGGISLLEITYDQSNSQSVQDTADTLRALNSALGDKMMFGAGTVISAQQVTVAVDAGAKFIISPNTDESVIAESVKRGVVSIISQISGIGNLLIGSIIRKRSGVGHATGRQKQEKRPHDKDSKQDIEHRNIEDTNGLHPIHAGDDHRSTPGQPARKSHSIVHTITSPGSETRWTG